MKFFTNFFLIIFCLLISNIKVKAQSAYGNLAGTVRTTEGKPAPYVSVGLTKTNRGTTTNENGYYELRNIKSGSYNVKISFIGVKTEEYTIIVVAGKTTRKDIKLTESAAKLNEVSITSSKARNKPVTLGKANIKPFDLPQSTGVITSQIIADQQAVRLGDVLKNVTGVSLTQNRGGVAETYAARGSLIGIGGGSGSIFKNGIISNTTGFPDASTLESIEVLKGSAALLYGSVSGGIVINMVTKKPRFDWGGEVSMLGGSYNQYKPTVDLYGPITKNLAFRVVGTHEDAKSYRDVVNTHRTYVNPSLLYKIGNKTDIILEGDFLKSDLTPDPGVGVPNNRITVTEMPIEPRNRFIYPTWAYNNTKQVGTYLTINQRFNDNWKLTSVGGFQNTQVHAFSTGVPMTIAANGDWTRTLSATNTNEKDLSEQLNLNGTFKTAGITHQLLVGADITRVTNESNTFKFTSASGVVGTAYDKINVFNSDTYNTRADVPNIADTARTTTPQGRYGIYIQDLISLTSKFKVLAGVRYSYQTAYHSVIFNYDKQQERNGAAVNKNDHAYSPKFALIYQPVQTTSIYTDYSNNFTYNTGTDIYGNSLPASIVDQYEAGVKNEFLNGRLSANFAIYRIRNSNLAQTALTDRNGNPNANTTLKTLTGQTTSDGAEIEVNGTLSKNFYFLSGYSYNFVRYTNTTGATGSQVEGERLVSSPAQTANGSIFYTFDKGKVKGLKLGASGFYTGKRTGGNNNLNGARPGELNSTATKNATTGIITYTSSYNSLIPLTGFTTFDLSAGYSFHHVSLLTKVSNIFNTFNYIVHDRYSLNPIPPRMFAATLAYKF